MGMKFLTMSTSAFVDTTFDGLISELNTNQVKYQQVDNSTIVVNKSEKMFNGDCRYKITQPRTIDFEIRYRTERELIKGKKQVEKFFKSKPLKGTAILDDMSKANHKIYIVEENSNKVKEYYIKSFNNYLEELDEEEKAKWIEEQCQGKSMYKIIEVGFNDLDKLNNDDIMDTSHSKDFVMPTGAPSDIQMWGGSGVNEGVNYITQKCSIAVRYMPMSKAEIHAYEVYHGYDYAAKKMIDLEEYKNSLDASLKDAIDKKAEEHTMTDVEWYELYMIDKHNVDITTYYADDETKLTDEEKREFYINRFNWDIDKKAIVDLASYNNSTDIYLAVEYNYNSNEKVEFASEKEQAIYLIDKNYNKDTKTSFTSYEECRLYMLSNYDYNIDTQADVTAEEKEKEIVVAAYEDFYNKSDEYYVDVAFNLVYIDNDDVPELIIKTDDVLPSQYKIYTYSNGEVAYVDMLYEDVGYAARTGMLYAKHDYLNHINGGGITIYKLEGTKLTTIGEGEYTSDRKYTWQGQPVTSAEYDKNYKDAIKQGEYSYVTIGSNSKNIREAYEKMH